MSYSVRSSRPSRASGALLLWLALLIPGLARADVALVRPDGSGDYPTIQAAIDAVPSGSEILLQSGVFSGVGNRALDLGTKVLTIRSIADDPDSCLIDCERAGRGFVVSGGQDSTTVLRGLRIENGFPADSTAGGAIMLFSSSPRIENCVLAGNETLHQGGGLACFSASPLLRDLEVVGNLAQDGGGIYADSFSIPVVERSTIAANRGLRHGGGLYSDASDTLRITRTIFWGNCADSSAAELRVADVVQFICSDLDSAGVGGPGTPSFDANTIFSDPLFCAPSLCSAAPQSSGSFALQSGSPASAALSLCGATIGGGPEGCFVPTGACCLADGSCLIASAADCATASGTYQGDNTVCSPNPCPPPTGACCLADGSCVIASAADCATASGTYQGDNTACTPNPC
ncbi:MAG: hypothetical protein IT349_13485, partial [Candidatus Eisenbacteria bacterium]|nr:hypothetical protein [Candidatus Eisenbacteria bacterium]